MNRMKKEELRRYREARAGLTPEEVAEVDRREAEERVFDDEVQLWHGRLFPEEYDFYHDSGADARARSRGINPMSPDYIARTDGRRKELGFGPYMSDGCCTRSWVRRMLAEGHRGTLAAIHEKREAEDDAREEAARRRPEETPEEIARALDNYLENWNADPIPQGLEPEASLAFCIYGFFMSRGAYDLHDATRAALRERLSELGDARLEDALAVAWENWLDIYEGG